MANRVPVVIEPKRTTLVTARIAGENPTFTIHIPATDADLLELAGANADGTAKLTYEQLGRDAFATRYQAVVSLGIAKDAVTSEVDGKKVYAEGQYLSDDALASIIASSEADTLRLLVGERASSGRKSADEKAKELIANKMSEMESQLQAQYDAASSKSARAVIAGMATAFGFTLTLAAE